MGRGRNSRLRTLEQEFQRAPLISSQANQNYYQKKKKTERKLSLRCALLLLQKLKSIPSADCQICSLSSFFLMMSMCGGPPLPLYRSRTDFSSQQSFSDSLSITPSEGGKKPATFQRLHLLISAFINPLIRSFQPN